MSTGLDDRIPRIVSQVDLLAEVERRGAVVVSQQGDVATCHCPHPNHPDDHPSFTVSASKQTWRCWSQCDRRGDVIELLCWLDGITKAEAIEKLAAQVGLERPQPASKPSPVSGKTGGVRRCIDVHTAERMLRAFLDRRGWPRELAAELDLSVVIDNYGHPRVRHPFRLQGEVVGHQDRLVGAGEPRWLSSRGPIRCPYEIDRLALAEERGHLVMVEGVADTVAVLAGFENPAVVGIPGVCGLKAKWAPAFRDLGVFLIADNDEAGHQLRQRADQLLRPVVRRLYHVDVPACFHDLDDWRQAIGDNEAWAEDLVSATVMAEAGVVVREAAS